MFRTLYAKLATGLALLLVAIGLLYAVISTTATRHALQELNQQLNRNLGTEILASAAVVERVGDRFTFEHAGSTTLKGFAEPIHVFALIAPAELALRPPAAPVAVPARRAGPERPGVPVARPR